MYTIGYTDLERGRTYQKTNDFLVSFQGHQKDTLSPMPSLLLLLPDLWN